MLLLVLACNDNGVTAFNAAPIAAILSPEDGAGVVGEVVLEGSATDPDHDESELVATWTVNGEVVCEDAPGQGGLTSCPIEVTEDVTVQLDVTDPMDGKDRDEIGLVRANTAPDAPTVAVDPSEPATGQALACTLVEEGQDPDGDEVSHAFSWSVDGEAWGDGAEVAEDTTDHGEVWTCSATASDGEDTSEPATAQAQVCPGVLQFDGVDDIVTVPGITSMDGNATMEAWVRLDAPPTSLTMLMSSQCTSLWVTPEELYLVTIDACEANTSCSGGWNNGTNWVDSNVPGGDGGFRWNGWDGSWTHIAVTVDPNHEGELFVDGQSVGRKTLSRDGCISTPTYGSLGRHDSSGLALDGQISAVRYSSSVRYAGDFTPDWPFDTDGDTVLNYRLWPDHGAATLTDTSGDGRTGTLTGPEWTTGGPPCE